MRKSIRRIALSVDVAGRLGAAPVAQALWHRSPIGRALATRRLRAPVGVGAVAWPEQAAPPPALPGLHVAALSARARGLGPIDWHGRFPANTHALGLQPTGGDDIRPVWERNRWAELPLLAQAARLDPGQRHDRRATALLDDWHAANPAFRGPNWVCGQEASLRALHLALALALADAAPGTALRRTFGQHGQRIAATPAYALAQDNNHPVSEAAGLLVCGLLAPEPDWVTTGADRLARTIRRLVAPCGAFSQLSTGYHRLLLDVVAVAAWLTHRHGGPALPPELSARMGAATLWLHRLTDTESGATPRLGHQDGSCFADLSLAGPDDARGSVERAARLFLGASADADPGCAWLGLAAPTSGLPNAPAVVRGEGLWARRAGGARAFLRTGPLRFRPGQADLLHFDLWDGGRNVLRDAGTGAYNPPDAVRWWHAHFTGTAAHNTIAFDGRDQMPRLGRFLFARWPRTGALPDGGWLRDHAGCRHARTVAVAGRRWTVTDTVAGGFATAALRWHLGDADWAATEDGVVGPWGRLAVTADAPVALRLEQAWHSPAYGVVRPCAVLVARATAPIARFATTIDLP